MCDVDWPPLTRRAVSPDNALDRDGWHPDRADSGGEFIETAAAGDDDGGRVECDMQSASPHRVVSLVL